MKGGAVGHNFERDLPKDHIPAKFSVIWFSGFRGEDLNVIPIMPILIKDHI
jgi:hypothetical protein